MPTRTASSAASTVVAGAEAADERPSDEDVALVVAMDQHPVDETSAPWDRPIAVIAVAQSTTRHSRRRGSRKGRSR